MAETISNYKYDVAISLCKEDVTYARKLVDAINPNLSLFFYEHKQEELISKSGPEAFAKVFKEESRVVVILSRNDWSNTFYTELEKNAIVDRLSSGKDGFGFLFVIPVAPKEIPIWYPETRIYADPTRFSIEELARFIEFKVTEQGGEVKPISFQERAATLVNKINNKKDLILSQKKPEAIIAAQNEIKRFKEIIHSKYEIEIKPAGFKSIGYDPHDIYNNNVYIIINEIQMNIRINDPWDKIIHSSNQVFSIEFNIKYKPNDDSLEKSPLYRYNYSLLSGGWSEVVQIDRAKVNMYNEEILFRYENSQVFYDLKGITSSEDLIENWFNKLLEHVSSEISLNLN